MKVINTNAKGIKIAIPVFLFFFGCFVPSVLGQINRSTISGYVFDQQRSPVGQVPVELLSEFNSVIQRTQTDGSGRFFFRGISQGRFAVRVLTVATNFEEQTQEVEISGIGVSGRPLTDNIQLDFYLKLRRDARGVTEVTGTIFVQEVPADARKLYDKSVVDINNKNVDAGILGLEKAIEIFPNYYYALEKLGTLLVSQQKFENARDIFNRAATVNDRSFFSWYGLSYANYSLKQSTKAVEAARKAVLINSNSIDAQLLLGITLRQDKQYQEAEKSLKLANKIANGKSSDAHWNLALLYAHNLKRFNDAADELELYLKSNSNVSDAATIKKLIKQLRETPPSSN